MSSTPSPDDAPAQRGTPWTRKQEAYLAWAYSQGLSLEWAAKHLRRSVAAVKQ